MDCEDIHAGMAAQACLVETDAAFHPRRVLMAPANEPGED